MLFATTIEEIAKKTDVAQPLNSIFFHRRDILKELNKNSNSKIFVKHSRRNKNEKE